MANNTTGLQSNEPLQNEVNSLDTKYAKLQHNHNELVKNDTKLIYCDYWIDPKPTLSDYFKEYLKTICKNNPNCIGCTFVCRVQPDVQGVAIIYIYDTNNKNVNGLPQYSNIVFFQQGLENWVYRFTSWESEWSERRI